MFSHVNKGIRKRKIVFCFKKSEKVYVSVCISYWNILLILKRIIGHVLYLLNLFFYTQLHNVIQIRKTKRKQYIFIQWLHIVCQKNLCTEEENVKSDLQSKTPTIKCLRTFLFLYTF